MPQVDTPKPRQFKFVGGPSRKRRCPNQPSRKLSLVSKRPYTAGKSSTASDEKEQIASPKETGMERAPPLPDMISTTDTTNNTSMVPSQLLSSEPVGSLFPPLADAAAAAATVTAANAAIAAPVDNSGGELFDWLSTGSMNPFFDPGLQFHDSFDQGPGPNGQQQVHFPFHFGPDIPFSQLWSSPITESSIDEAAADLPDHTAVDDGVSSDGSARDRDVDSGIADEAEMAAPQSLNLPHASGNISDTISQLLARYDKEFCVMPLTHDFEANPFRFNAETGRGSQLLLHCILALSYRHIHRETGACLREAKTHKKAALQMLSDVERGCEQGGSPENSSFEANFLDAVLILMTLDCATSAHGPWIWYLKRALKMIEATEPTHVRKTPRMQARIEMLVWWDVTLALTSRRGCVLSEATVLSLFHQEGADAPTFYSVSGCPEDLFKYMVRLGKYAREFELANSMTCVDFNMAHVQAVEQKIREWSFITENHDVTIPDTSGDTESQLPNVENPGDVAQYREDLHHCAEAWRYALLIYIERVFKWDRNKATSSMLAFFARKTLNHVASCRRITMLQKQLLLPVFLAGCETRDECLRDEARDYCTWWNEKTRYDMFLTAIGLLEEVWANEDPRSWWGSIIDQKTQSPAGGRVQRQYLFG